MGSGAGVLKLLRLGASQRKTVAPYFTIDGGGLQKME
jgi:hypothetical protein